MRVWITKWVLGSGIQVVDGAKLGTNGQSIEWDGGRRYLYGKRHWHESEEAAQAVARKMIENRQKSLRKQLAKLDAILASLPAAPGE